MKIAFAILTIVVLFVFASPAVADIPPPTPGYDWGCAGIYVLYDGGWWFHCTDYKINYLYIPMVIH